MQSGHRRQAAQGAPGFNRNGFGRVKVLDGGSPGNRQDTLSASLPELLDEAARTVELSGLFTVAEEALQLSPPRSRPCS